MPGGESWNKGGEIIQGGGNTSIWQVKSKGIFKTSTLTVSGSSPSLIVPENDKRLSVKIFNEGPNILYVGSPSVSRTGFPVTKDSSVTLEYTTSAIYGVLAGGSSPKVPIERSCQGAWFLDETSGSTCYDNRGNNHNGTAIGTTITTGVLNNCRNFDGVDDYIDMGDVLSLDYATELTLSAWINHSVLPREDEYQAFVVRYQHGVYRDRGYSIADTGLGSSTLLNFDILGSNNYNYLTYSWFPSTGTWYHIVGTWKKDNFMRIYINGTKVKEGTTNVSSIEPTGPGRFSIGAGYIEGSVTGCFNGKIDEVYVYDVALSDDEILALYNSGAPYHQGASNVRILEESL